MSKRSEVLRGSTRKLKTGCGNLYLTANETEDGQCVEVFIKIGKAGGCASSQAEAIGRLISIALQSGSKIEDLIRTMRGISCHQQVFSQDGKILSCCDAVAKGLELYLKKKNRDEGSTDTAASSFEAIAGAEMKKKPDASDKNPILSPGACPECGGPLRHEEGCEKCVCGYTKC
jgi:ribonucleoside-diphosphate reductase alpha chain